ncbi:hypothetical protein BQ8482_60140 [Mesorhizobium delmotii]|uniref:Uncharacterized protein n=1 Tax=Mesorhizobium delmotii TaxID=1631247 RepID=A0A2P9AVI7_9HYPH|nr:hypothetical protein BQ8482_60140 [Mesorhizobium delmotii]
MAITQIAIDNNVYLKALLDGGYKWSNATDANGNTIITTPFVGTTNQDPERTFFWEDAGLFSAINAWEQVAAIDIRHVAAAGNIRIETGTQVQEGLDNFEFGTTERLFSKVMVDFTRVRFNNWRGRHRRHQGYRGRRHHGARIRRPGRPQWCPLLCLLAHRQRRGNGRPSVRLRTRTGTLASCFVEA